MGKIKCCICPKIIQSNQRRDRVGTPSLWPFFKSYVAKKGFLIGDFGMDDVLCKKHYVEVRHALMTDRGPNKIQKPIPPPISRSPNITAGVLRSAIRETSHETSLETISNEQEPASEEHEPESNRNMSSADSNSLDVDCQDIEAMINNMESQSFDDIDFWSNGSEEPQSLSLDTSQSQEVPSIANSQFSMDTSQSQEVPSIDNSQFSTNSQMSSVSSQTNSSSQIDLTVKELKTCISTQNRCFVCGDIRGRSRIPVSAVRQAFQLRQIYIPLTNRCCKSHLVDQQFSIDVLETIEVHKLGMTFASEDLLEWMIQMTRPNSGLPDFLRVDFSHDGLSEKDFILLTGLKKDDFNDLFETINPYMRNSSNRHCRNALGMLLMTLRLNLSQSFLAFLFRTEQQILSDAIASVCHILENRFVPKHLGYNQVDLSREDALRIHSRKLLNSLFEQTDDVLFLIADGTYIYVQRPTDFAEQRKTYSMHKHRNLQKCMMIIFPSGHILDVNGMYGADNDNNDATILKLIMKTSNLLTYVQGNDHIILDRGFRDVVDDLEATGLTVLMPKLLKKGQKQFTTAEGNASRKVTMVRWTVESVNGRLKNVFKFFEGVVPGAYKNKIGTFVRISCALLNKYYGPIFKNKERHETLAALVVEREECNNNFAQKNSTKGLVPSYFLGVAKSFS